MATEEEIKRRMLQQQMAAAQQQAAGHMLQQQAQQQQLETALREVMRHVLTPQARERLANLKSVKPDIASSLELYLAQLYQAGQIRGQISEAQLIDILTKINEKKEFRITRR